MEALPQNRDIDFHQFPKSSIESAVTMHSTMKDHQNVTTNDISSRQTGTINGTEVKIMTTLRSNVTSFVAKSAQFLPSVVTNFLNANAKTVHRLSVIMSALTFAYPHMNAQGSIREGTRLIAFPRNESTFATICAPTPLIVSVDVQLLLTMMATHKNTV